MYASLYNIGVISIGVIRSFPSKFCHALLAISLRHGVSDLRSKGEVSLADEAIATFPEHLIAVYLERNIVVLVIGTAVFEVTEYLQVEVES